MPLFTYQAKDKEEKLIQGNIKAENQNKAGEILIQQGFTVLSLKQKDNQGLNLEISFLNRVSFKELVFFCRQLSVMISASMPLAQSLRLLTEQTENKYFKKVLNKVSDEVEEGTKFSKALSAYPNVFSDYFTGMVKTGESSGNLKHSLEYLAVELEASYGLRSKVLGAMLYPAFLIVALLGIGILMMVVVVPPLTQTLTESGAVLPITTRILIGTSNALKNFWYLFLVGLIIVISSFLSFRRTDQGKYYFSLFILKVPLISRLVKMTYVARIASSLGTLLKGGLPALPALRLVGESMSNAVYKQSILKIVQDVENGEGIAKSFAKFPNLIPMIMVQMMHVGEKTGKIDGVLLKLAKFYKREMGNLLKSLVSLLEPIILIIMGIGVAIMVASIILPIYQVAMNSAK